MLPYWILLSIFALGTLTSSPPGTAKDSRGIALLLAIFGLACFIGLRDNVGADWVAYVRMYRYAGLIDFGRVLTSSDPGFLALNWIVNAFDGSLYLVNLIGAGVFCWGLYRLAQTQPDPWVSVLIAIPYLVIVVAMNFNRQSLAIGFIMAGVASLIRDKSSVRFIVYAFIAASFHVTAIISVPIVLFGYGRNRALNIFVFLVGLLIIYFGVLRSHFDSLLQNYIGARYQAQGAAIRVAMDVLPASIFAIMSKRLGFEDDEWRIWRNFSIMAFVALAALFLVSSSAAVDRLAIYLLPLQIAVIGRLPRAINSVAAGRALVIAYCVAVLWVWLNYADNAFAWLPYQNVMF